MIIHYLKNKFKLIDKFVDDALNDIRSLRFQLLLISVGLNIWIIKQIVCCGLNYTIGITSLGLLSIVFTYWFAASHNQAVNEHKKKERE